MQDHPDRKLPKTESLERIGPDAADAVPALLRALKDDDDFIRGQVANCLESIAGFEALPALKETARSDSDEDVRFFAQCAIRAIVKRTRGNRPENTPK